MSIVNRSVLKGYFADAKVPTASNFGDFIDSTLNQANAGITIDAANRFGLGTAVPGAALSVQPQTLLPMTGTVSVAINSTAVIGTGTLFTQELDPGGAIRIAGQLFQVVSIASDTSLTLDIAFPATGGPQTNVPAYRDGAAFAVGNGVGNSLMVIDQVGNMGVGVATPGALLDVGGTARAVAFVGNGAGLTGLDAGQLSGTLVSTGSFNVVLTGTAAIPANSTAMTGTGTHFTTQLAVGDALQLTTGGVSTVFTVATITSDTQLTVTAAPTAAIATASLATLGALFEAKTQAGVAAVTIDKSGTVRAVGFAGSGAALTDLDAGQLSGTLISTGSFNVVLTGTAAIPANSTAMTGTGTHFTTQLAVGDALQLTTAAGSTSFTVATITSDTALTVTAAPIAAIANASLATLGALFEAKTQAGVAAVTVDKAGTISAAGFIGSGAGLTGIQASQISGSFTPAQIPDIPAAKVTGTLAVAQIPDLRDVQVLFYSDTPVIVGTGTATVSWMAESSYALTLTYVSGGAKIVKSSANGDFPAGSGSYTASGIYQDTLFSLTAASGGQTVYQRQLAVSVVLTPAQYTSLIQAAGTSLVDAISSLYYRFNYNPTDLTMIQSLGYALASAGYSVSGIFLDVANFYIATAGITTLSSAQIKALTAGVDQGSGG